MRAILSMRLTRALIERPYSREPASLSGYQHDLAVGAGFHNKLMRTRRVRKRKVLTDHGPERSIFKTCHNGRMNLGKFGIRGGPEDQSQYCSFAGHRVARVYFDGASVADHHNPSSLSEHAEIFRQIDISQHFRDEIDAASSGDAHDLLFVVHHSVIHDIMSPLRRNQGAAFVAPRRTDDRHSQGARELQAGNPDTAARPMNKQHFTGPGAPALEQRAIRGA